MKLLIVEDNGEMRRLLKRLLTGLAAEIHECDDGREATELYSRIHPDWVLMDIEMKETDGITATKLIKAFDPDAKIIIVTNYDETALREAAHSAGACGYLLKENLLDLNRLLRPPKTARPDGGD